MSRFSEGRIVDRIVVNGIDLILILSQIPGAAVINLIGGLLTIVVSTALIQL